MCKVLALTEGRVILEPSWVLGVLSFQKTTSQYTVLLRFTTTNAADLMLGNIERAESILESITKYDAGLDGAENDDGDDDGDDAIYLQLKANILLVSFH